MKKFINKIESKLDSGSGPSAAPAQVPDLGAQPSQRQIYYHRRQYGVNLGSWFTLEAWLTGSLFQGAKDPKDSEMDLLEGVGPDKAKEILEGHWDNFINDGDWQWMASHGVNTVRIPISYYHFLPGHPDHSVQKLMDGTEYEKYASVYVGAFSRIQRAIQTAASHGIGVLVDLHAVPGAQNTDGHSGLSTKKAGLWDGMSSSKNQKRTVSILEALASEVSKYDNVVGLELLNEPKNNGSLQSFYETAIKAIRKQGSNEAMLPLYLGDAWDLNHYSAWVSKQAGAGNFLVIDHHLYRCFTKEDHSTSASEHAKRIHPSHNGPTCKMLGGASSSLGGSLIIGEWSAALNPGSLQGQNQDDAQREWGQAQVDAYSSQIGGNFYWTLKKEGKPDAGWCLYTAVETGVIPANLGRPRGGADLEQRGQQAGAQALQSHSNYWNDHGAKGDHREFQEGFSQGWKDALQFWNGAQQSQIGFAGQWSKLRAEAWKQQGGIGKAAWEYEHGCTQAIQGFNAALSG